MDQSSLDTSIRLAQEGEVIFRVSLTSSQWRYINRLMPTNYILKKGNVKSRGNRDLKNVAMNNSFPLPSGNIRSKSRMIDSMMEGESKPNGLGQWERERARGEMSEEEEVENRWFS